ncbi:VanW family protein [Streptomyces sp. NPDC006798]|uniref:VanW family protein n=1 Tax=Streptomyces sp. NPDC006798 TaxID=3155462 RepID=UPI0033D5AD87
MLRRIHPAALVGGAVVLGTGALYVTGLLVTGDEVPGGTSVRGVAIGGLSESEARAKLDKDLAALAAAPVAVTVGDKKDTVSPAAAGLSFDTAKTAAEATRSDKDPFTVIGNLFSSGGGAVEPVVTMDEEKAKAALDALAKKHDREMRNGGITFDKGRAKETPSVTGQSLNVDKSVGELRTAFSDGASGGPADLPVKETAPKTDAAEIERVMREFAEPAMSEPVTLTTGGKKITVTTGAIGRALTIAPGADGKLAPKLDGAKLLKDGIMAPRIAAATNEAKDATLRLSGGRVEVAADGTPGREIDAKGLTAAVMPLLTKEGAEARTGEVATVVTQPKLTRESVAAMGLTETVSSFTANFETAAYRTTNIGRAAELINGSTVLPGETWSFNDTVGERTPENGFVDGIIILNDKYTKAAGGGVSTVATAVFNAMFFAGVKPVEYGAHSFYIERYPEGREATVAWGSLDLRFKNDTGKAIQILAGADNDSVTVTFVGTKKYDEIKAEKGERTNVKEPGTRPGAKKDCQPQTPLEGFDVTVQRIFIDNGQEVKREPFKTRYTPRDEVTCD